MSERYTILKESKSGHCCFQATVMDTTKPDIIGGEHYMDENGDLHYKTVCECFEIEDAEVVAKALNLQSEEV